MTRDERERRIFIALLCKDVPLSMDSTEMGIHKLLLSVFYYYVYTY